MFRFLWNHHQALSEKNTDPLHRTIKTPYGITNVHNKIIFTEHMSLFPYCSIGISGLNFIKQ